jgi:hypothetical protein
MARLTPEEEKGLMEAYAKVYEQKNLQEGPLDAIPMSRSRQNRQNQINALRTSAKPFMNQGKVTVSSNNATGTPKRIDGGGGNSAGSGGGSTGGSVKVDGKALMNKLRAGSSGGGAGSSGGGAGGSVGSAGGQAAVKKPGLLGRLGSLAGKAVKTAGNVAGNVAGAARNVAGNVASGIKAGAKAVGSALANKGPMQGSRSRFNNRGGSSGAAPTTGAVKSTGSAAPKATLSNNSPAAKAGIPLAQRQAAADKNAAFQAARKSGNLAQYRKDNPKLSGAERAQAMAKARIAAKNSQPAQSPQRRVTQVMDLESYDPIFDETVHFLISEGHVQNESEAISIMSEPEFIESFNEELYG